MGGCQSDGGDNRGDNPLGDNTLGVTESPNVINPSLPIREREEDKDKKERKKEKDAQKLSKDSLSPDLQKELTELGVFTSIWSDVSNRLQAGWIEADVIAVISWMRDTRKTQESQAAGFVTRLREGTKAPSIYYPGQSPKARTKSRSKNATYSDLVGHDNDLGLDAFVSAAKVLEAKLITNGFEGQRDIEQLKKLYELADMPWAESQLYEFDQL